MVVVRRVRGGGGRREWKSGLGELIVACSVFVFFVCLFFGGGGGGPGGVCVCVVPPTPSQCRLPEYDGQCGETWPTVEKEEAKII